MKDLFTVCITHYNQMKYIFTAIDSVLKQDYPNIELVIADDGSKEFDKTKVQEYIEKKKKKNIQNVIFSGKEKNVGTVKNMNQVLKVANGKYISFFAADDELSDSKVISNYVDSFVKYDKDVITAQAFLYDEKLNKNDGPYVDIKEAEKFNKMTPLEVFPFMAKSCFYASGATAYRMTVFNEYGLFDEKYLLVEDWSYYLHLLKNNVQVFFVDFPALNHRHGGVSHNDKITPTVKKYQEDILKIYENELLNDMPNIPKKKMLDIYNKCEWDINYICDLIESDKKDYYLKELKKSKRRNIGNSFNIFMLTLDRRVLSFLKWHVYYKFKYLNRDYHIFVVTFIYWIITNILLNYYYVEFDSLSKIMVLLFTLIGSAFAANLFTGIGDMMEYCVPFTLLACYHFNILDKPNILEILLFFIPFYIVIYYTLYILRIIKQKIIGRISR